jgi:Uroporphyrinogen decarboxylase (URO-D)
MKKLTSRERLDRCYRHLEVDRPGLFLRGITAEAPDNPTYRPLRELVLEEADQKVFWSIDHLVAPLKTSRTVEPYSDDFERTITTLHTPAGDLRSSYLAGLKGQPGMPEEHFVKTVEDVETFLSLPKQDIGGEVSTFFEQVEKTGDRGIVEIHLGMNAGGYVAELLGSTAFALFSLHHREALHALARQRTEHLVRIVTFLRDTGVGPYFAILGQEYVAPPLHGPQDFHDFNTQYDRAIADPVHEADGRLHVHCHGPLKEVLGEFVEMGADVLHPIEAPPMCDVTAKMAKDAFRDKVCIEGNVQIGDMYAEGADAIRAMVTELIEDAFDDRKGLIVSPTASPYVPMMTEECFKNYAALIDVVTNWSPP